MGKFIPEPNSGCWIWTASTKGFGYGTFYLNGRSLSAHRASYALLVGDLIKGMEICHKCNNPSCVNPHHLYQGTHKQNMEDMSRYMKETGKRSANWLTHCKRGHELIFIGERKLCRECRNIVQNKWRAGDIEKHKIHLLGRFTKKSRNALCERRENKRWFEPNITNDWDAVTCKRCVKLMNTGR
jgi:hypothetical protein